MGYNLGETWANNIYIYIYIYIYMYILFWNQFEILYVCIYIYINKNKNNKKLSLSHSFSTKNKKAKTLLSKISQKHLLLHEAPSQFSLLIFLIPPSLFGSPSQPSISLTLTPAFTPNTQQWREHSSHLRK